MRRLLGVLGLIGVGVLLGFVARLLWPRPADPARVDRSSRTS